jgi:hypothetical protein
VPERLTKSPPHRQADAMPKGEREDLQRLIRQREKVLKSAAKQRSAELLADFENQLASQYAFDDDKVWKEAAALTEQELAKANAKIAARSAALGIPAQFAPRLAIGWQSRGENSVKDRRAELRKVAVTRIEAIEAKAITEIQLSCLGAQERVALAGLTSEAARLFIEKLPGIETLMPRLSYDEIAGEADPPVAEQLVSPNALRQRRFRDKASSVTAERYGGVTGA